MAGQGWQCRGCCGHTSGRHTSSPSSRPPSPTSSLPRCHSLLASSPPRSPVMMRTLPCCESPRTGSARPAHARTTHPNRPPQCEGPSVRPLPYITIALTHAHSASLTLAPCYRDQMHLSRSSRTHWSLMLRNASSPACRKRWSVYLAQTSGPSSKPKQQQSYVPVFSTARLYGGRASC